MSPSSFCSSVMEDTAVQLHHHHHHLSQIRLVSHWLHCTTSPMKQQLHLVEPGFLLYFLKQPEATSRGCLGLMRLPSSPVVPTPAMNKANYIMTSPEHSEDIVLNSLLKDFSGAPNVP